MGGKSSSFAAYDGGRRADDRPFDCSPSAGRRTVPVLAKLRGAERLPAFIVEKNFWVCWLLGRIFATPQLGAGCVFKGGTSLSKVFGAIAVFLRTLISDLPRPLGAGTNLISTKRHLSPCARNVPNNFKPTAHALCIQASCPNESPWWLRCLDQAPDRATG